MKVYLKKWWKRLFKPSPAVRIDSERNIFAVIEFLENVASDTQYLLPDLKQLLELERERKIAASGIIHINIDAQAKLLDKILERFSFFQSDTAINEIRIRHIAEQLMQEAKNKGMTDLVRSKQKAWSLD